MKWRKTKAAGGQPAARVKIDAGGIEFCAYDITIERLCQIIARWLIYRLEKILYRAWLRTNNRLLSMLEPG